MRKWVWAIAMILTSSRAFASDGALLSVVMDKIRFQQWENAEAFAQHAKDPMVREILDWHELRAGRGEFAEFDAFLEENSDWPGLPYLQARGEVKIPIKGDSQKVIDFIEHNGPQTEFGFIRYIEALVATGDAKKARTVFDENVNDMELSLEQMDEIRGFIKSVDKAEFLAVAHNLLLKRKPEIARKYLDEFIGNDRAVLEARLVIVENKGGIDAALARLTDEQKKDPYLTYERARYAFHNRNRSAAAKLMREISTSRETLGFPELWMRDEMRTRLAGDAMWVGDGVSAYDMVANHFLEPDEEGYALAEWTAGFVALEFLKQPKVARAHFENFKNAVGTPISLGRAGYWLGRAGDPDGYAFGAQYQAGFYGQLSAEMGGIAPDESLINAPQPKASDALIQRDSVHAAMLFFLADEKLLARRFLAHQAETVTPEEAEALGVLAVELDIPHAAVNIGKNLAFRGEMITHSNFPIPKNLPEGLTAPMPLVLAITRQESEFYQYAESYVGAKGYMQLMPGTAELMSNKLGLPYDVAGLKSDGQYNMILGSGYLADVGAQYENRIPYIAVGYNAGPGRVKEWIEKVGTAGPSVEKAVYWLEMIRFEETRNYVQRVLEGAYIYDAKLNGEFRLKPSDLLLKPYW